MAIATTYPGVYIEEVPSGVRPIESASTSTAAFIGKTGKMVTVAPTTPPPPDDEFDEPEGGPELPVPAGTVEVSAPTSEPKLIFKWADYVNEFGGIQNLGDLLTDEMGLAVYNFFLNGGGMAYIVHVNENDTGFSYMKVLHLSKSCAISASSACPAKHGRKI